MGGVKRGRKFARQSSSGNGCIVHDVIAVDLWHFESSDAPPPRLFFLSHLHHDHIEGLNGSWSRGPIYTSPTNVKISHHFLSIPHPETVLVPLQLDIAHTLQLDAQRPELDIKVTLLDANHVPGAVMFLFQGYFGNVLYTGDFRYDEQTFTKNPIIARLAEQEAIDDLFLDNTFFFKSYTFEDRVSVADRLIDFLLALNPTTRIYFGARLLGKEDLYVKVALAMSEKICIDMKRMALYSDLSLPDVFTCDPDDARMFIVSQHLLTHKHILKSSSKGQAVGIIASALYYSWPLHTVFSKHTDATRIRVFEYSDHSSYPELIMFVKCVKPKRVWPIVRDTSGSGFLADKKNFLAGRCDLTALNSFLSTKPQPQFLKPTLTHLKKRLSPTPKRPAVATLDDPGSRALDRPEADATVSTVATAFRRLVQHKQRLERRAVYRGPMGPVFDSSSSPASASTSCQPEGAADFEVIISEIAEASARLRSDMSRPELDHVHQLLLSLHALLLAPA